ncbi:OFA family MFS transporter [candidate division KSB1 bacterium]|nr:OFA family MFS transporter [candidate division KSB1 bacterium]
MSEKKVMNRWLPVAGAILIQLALGAIYAWSVFTPALQKADWTKAQTQYVFSAGLAFFAIVMVLAGKMMPKVGPKKLAISGGIVLGLGYILGGLLGGTSPFLLTLFIGVIGGSGIGLAYVVPIAVGMRWFPDKKGLITGLAVAGFGFGAMLWVKLAGEWGLLIDKFGLSTTFTIYGIIFLVMVIIGGMWMVFPPEGWKPAGWTPPPPKAGQVAAGVAIDSSQMLKTAQFYMIFLTFVFSGGAGLMTIGLMKLFPKEALQSVSGMSEGQASAVAGTAMAVFFSLANGLGRIVWGTLSDKLGRKLSVVIMCATQGLFMIAFTRMAGVPGLLFIASIFIGFNFGGNFALFPTLTADTFGAKFIGQNYPWVFLAYGVGGIFGPILGGKLGDLGNFPAAFIGCGILCIIAAGITMAIKPPKAA